MNGVNGMGLSTSHPESVTTVLGTVCKMTKIIFSQTDGLWKLEMPFPRPCLNPQRE